MEKIIRVLQVVRKMDMGGVQSMLMNYYRNIDREKVQFDYLVQTSEEGFYDKEIIAMGGHVHRIKPIKNKKSFSKELIAVIKINDYKLVHVHENFRNMYVLFILFINRVPCRISHSHNSYPEKSAIRKFLKKIASFFINIFSTHRYACSNLAADWLYGSNSKKIPKVEIINNAIDTDAFIFNITSRLQKRIELKLTNNIIIGHIGNFSSQKNHNFLIEIFNEIHLIEDRTHLVLVGEGELLEDTRRKVRELKLVEKVSFLGRRSDTNHLFQAFDVFIFPSFYEGLPVVVVEAQASGLKCIISDKISKEIEISKLVYFMKLTDDAATWARLVLDSINVQERENMSRIIKENNYDIVLESKKLEKKYIDMYAERTNGGSNKSKLVKK